VKLITSAQQVRDANDTQYRNVPVPEWGDEDTELRIRSMSANEIRKFTNLKGDNQKSAMARAIVMCAVDETGDTIFTSDDINWMMDKSVAVLHRLQDAILILNGMKNAPTDDEDSSDDEVTKAGKG
jgi:hypothetical protein